jgi:hypothetical protein
LKLIRVLIIEPRVCFSQSTDKHLRRKNSSSLISSSIIRPLPTSSNIIKLQLISSNTIKPQLISSNTIEPKLIPSNIFEAQLISSNTIKFQRASSKLFTPQTHCRRNLPTSLFRHLTYGGKFRLDDNYERL